MKKYDAIFDSYKFDNKNKKIMLRNIRSTNKVHIKEAYMDAMRVPYLIGNLVLGQKVEFFCNSIERKKVNAPKWIKYKECK